MVDAPSRASAPVLLTNLRCLAEPDGKTSKEAVSSDSSREDSIDGQNKELDAKTKDHMEEDSQPVCCKHLSQVGWFSFLTFGWITPMLQEGKKRQVCLADAPDLAPREDTMLVTRRLLDNLGKVERHGLSHPLLRATVLTFWPEYLTQKLIGVAQIFMGLMDPLLLQQVLIWQEAQNDGVVLDSTQTRKGIIAVVCLVLLGAFKILWSHQVSLYNHRVHVRTESALRGAVMARCVQGKPWMAYSSACAKKVSSMGEESKSTEKRSPAVYNLISHDIGPNVGIIGVIIGMWLFPIGFSATVILLVDRVHAAVVPGLVVGLCMKAVVFLLKWKDGYLRHRLMKAKDARLSSCRECFDGIRILKMLAWTEPFYERIMESRAVELRTQKLRLWCSHLIDALNYSSGSITNFVTLVFFVMNTNESLKASTWLPVTALIGSMVGPFGSFPNWMHQYLVWRDAYGRVNAFMGYEDRFPMVGRSCYPPIFLLMLLFSGVMTGLARIFGFVTVGIIWSGVWSIIWCFVGLGFVFLLSRKLMQSQYEADHQAEIGANDEAADYEAFVVAEMRDCSLTWRALTTSEAAPFLNPTETNDAAMTISKAADFSLNNVHLRMRAGELLVLVGSQGQGKTSLMSALLGEMSLISGELRSPAIDRRSSEAANIPTTAQMLPATMASVRRLLREPACGFDGHVVPYAAQDAMIFTGSVRENVMFGSTFDAEIYESVLKACALDVDLASMPAGDLSDVAQGGTTLSGGQRARVALARAVYRAVLALSRQKRGAPPPLVLLDDSLSALDKNVCLHVLRSLFGQSGGLLKHCAVVLATADQWWLELIRADLGMKCHLATIQNRRVYSECGANDASAGCEASSYRSCEAENVEVHDGRQITLEADVDGVNAVESEYDMKGGEPVREGAKGSLQQASRIIQEEHRETGSVRWRTYAYYIRAVGPVTLTFLLFALFNIMLWQMACSLWIVYWTDVNKPGKMHTLVQLFTDDPPHKSSDLLLVFGIFVLLFTASNFAGHSFEVIGGVRAARQIFSESLKGALWMPFQWWDENPTGRVLNRFSEDVETMDNAITFIMGIIFGAVLYFLYHIIMLGIANPISLAFLPFIILGMEYYARFYRKTIREVQRIWLTCMSIVYQDMVEAILGRATVCAFDNSSQILCKSLDGLNRLQRIAFAKETINMWLGLRMGAIGYVMAIYAKIYPVLQYYGVLSPQSAALVGFSIQYSQQTVDIISQFIGNYSDLEMQLISIERFRDYVASRKENFVDSTVALDILIPRRQHAPRLELTNVTITYREGLPPALRNANLRVAAQESIAVVGRTGAGKSSLLLAILQLVPHEGCVEVDGVLLSSLPSERTRRRFVGVVPQHPLLFVGSLRWNLDPHGEWENSDLRAALETVGLNHLCDEHSLGLEVPLVSREHGSTKVGDGAAVSLSQGQCQLLCAARILLRKQRVVLLDEVTSTLPQETASATVRSMVSHFKSTDAAVLLVTHKDEVVSCCERIVTISRGEVISDVKTSPTRASCVISL